MIKIPDPPIQPYDDYLFNSIYEGLTREEIERGRRKVREQIKAMRRGEEWEDVDL